MKPDHKTSIAFLMLLYIFLNSCYSHAGWNATLLSPNSDNQVDGLNIGAGQNDGVQRLYGSVIYGGQGLEWTISGGKFIGDTIYSGLTTHCFPQIGDVSSSGKNTVYVGAWSSVGVESIVYDKVWKTPAVISATSGKGDIFAMKIGDACNDGKKRLYIGTSSGLYQYTWSGQTVNEVVVLNSSVGGFDIGNGRNDGVNRIYAGERGGYKLHELTWNGSQFKDTVIHTITSASQWTTHVGDARGDGKNRLYAWAYGVMEFTYTNNKWDSVTVDPKYGERYYIRSGMARSDSKPGLYVSQKGTGLIEYLWNNTSKKYDYDAITSATGGCAIGDIRGEGKNRIYVASGSKGNFTNAAAVELQHSSNSIGNLKKKAQLKGSIIGIDVARSRTVIKLNLSEPASITIFSIDGKQLCHNEAKQEKSGEIAMLSPAITLTNGAYILSVQSQNHEEHRLFIVQ